MELPCGFCFYNPCSILYFQKMVTKFIFRVFIKSMIKISDTVSFLKTPAHKKFPEYICYRHPKKDIYHLANNKGELVGRMRAYPEYIPDNDTYYPNASKYFSLYIQRLFIKPEFRDKKAGTAMLNIAAKDSFRRSCHGKVHLIAGAIENLGKPPQKFYRRFGFDSQYKSHIKYIDEAIKNNTPLPKNIKWETPMFLPRLMKHIKI